MTALNLSSNDIGRYTVPDGWKYFPDNTRNTRFYNTATKKNQGEPPKGACQAGVIAIANAIPNMGALSSLSLKSSELISHGDQGKAAGKALGDMLAVNTVLTELDLSSNGEYSNTNGVGFAQELAVGLKDNGALSSVNLLQNSIPVEQAEELVEIMHTKENLTTLCGLSGEETGLDFSNRYLGGGDAVLIANDIKDNGALTKLNISNNNIEQGEALQRIADLCNTEGIELDNHKSKSESDGDY
jgi:hypothetical protein